MVELAEMKEIAAEGDGAVAWDTVTDSLVSDPRPGQAVLFVKDVTDAVKRVAGDRVKDSLDREELWDVRGVLLGPQVLDKLGDDGELPLGALVRAVEDAGYAWRIEEINPSDP